MNIIVSIEISGVQRNFQYETMDTLSTRQCIYMIYISPIRLFANGIFNI